MKILHTSDWHLGRNGFGQFSLLEDQLAFIDWLVALVAAEEVDLVAIAGDVYDRAIPPPEAVRLFERALAGLRNAGAEVAAIAGNHDSPDRFAVYSAFTTASGVLLRGNIPSGPDVAVREYVDGPLAIIAVPYLEPRRIPASAPILEGHIGAVTHDALVGHCLDAAKAEIPHGMRSLVLAHGWVAGGEASPSERDISVGGLGHIGGNRFDGFSYTALGHLHRPQLVGGRENVVYSGSPLAYSFSETGPKSVVLVEMASDGACATETREIPVGRGVRTVTGTFEELMQLEADESAFIKAELTDTGPVRDAKRRLSSIFPYLAEISLVGQRTSASQHKGVAALKELTDSELIAAFFAETTGSAPSAEELRLVLSALEDDATEQELGEAAA